MPGVEKDYDESQTAIKKYEKELEEHLKEMR